MPREIFETRKQFGSKDINLISQKTKVAIDRVEKADLIKALAKVENDLLKEAIIRKIKTALKIKSSIFLQ